MPIDIKLLRVDKNADPEKIKAAQENVERVKKSQRDRFTENGEKLVDDVIELDEGWRKANYQMESAKMEFNAINKEIGDRKKVDKKAKVDDLMEKSKGAKALVEEKK